MKKSLKYRIGLFLSMLLVLFLLSNCRTAKSKVDKMKEDFEKAEFIKYKHDSISYIERIKNIQKNKEDNWSEFWNVYDLSFIGQSNEDEFEVIKTDSSYKFKGKGTASIKNKSNSGHNNSINSENEKQKDNVLINSESEKTDKVEQSSFNIDKSKQNTSTGFNWNITIVLIISVVTIIVLIWKFGIPKIMNKIIKKGDLN